ncbi:MAG: hypothetical protein K6B45_11485 [Bacteroidaceae bacterium]|nr:hypothetical protein [Bacteroidaceae bacterium]
MRKRVYFFTGKICLLFFSSIVGTSALAQTTEMQKWFGFKGKVEKAQIYSDNEMRCSYSFDSLDGILVNPYIEFDETERKLFNENYVSLNKGGFNGVSDKYGPFTVSLKNNLISKVVFKNVDENSGTYTRTFTYDKDGHLTKLNELYIYYTVEGVEYGANISGMDQYTRETNQALNEYSQNVNNSLEEYQRDLARNPLNYMDAANRASNQINNSASNAANRITNAAGGVGVNAYANTKKKKHTVVLDVYYSNYVFDEFGNWTSRTSTSKNGTFSELQIIEYESDFWSNYFWEKLQKEGDLWKIEAFFNHPKCSKKCKKLASSYWNERILDEIKINYNCSLDSLVRVSSSSIIEPNVKEDALNIVREAIFKEKVLTLRDFSAVPQMKDFSYDINRKGISVPLFNDEYKKKITAHSENLRADSIAKLTDAATAQFKANDFSSALKTSENLLNIDENNDYAKNMAQEACFELISAKENDNTIKEEDYENFINSYSYSPHLKELQNRRALYASSFFNKSTTNEELERVVSLPTDEMTRKEVNKRYKKWKYRINRGKFFHLGLGGEYAVGLANSVAGGELTMRLGYTINFVNVTAGLKYNYLTSTPQSFAAPSEAGKGYFERQYLSAPVMLRFNVKRDYSDATYIAAGAEFNFANFSSKLRDINDIKDDNFANKNMVISPRFAFGGRLFGIELELFATYDKDNLFNVEYIENYTLENGQSIQTACEKDSYEKQIKSNNFLDKVRGGLSLRLWF